ncbi:hypothetical protein Tco_1020249 [Tanacetum coccineum]|uniref:Uncharacterized protein n=1 Tax=Tanacetum coccineum TaxID=301880 RepID=A0ABQ5FZJ5_9ASTR
MIMAIQTADRTLRPTFGFTKKIFTNMKFKWEGQPIPLTPPMLAIAAVGNDADDDDDAANEDTAANDAAGSAAEAHPVPLSPPVSPGREPTPERQPASERPSSPSPTLSAQTFSFEDLLAFGPAPRPDGYVDPDDFDQILFGPHPRPSDFVDPDLEEPIIFGPPPRPDDYIESEDIDNLVSMEDDTAHGGFHVESPAGPNDAPTPTADAAGRAEDPTILTSLSAKLDRCMGRIDSLETELGTTKKLMGGAILTLVSRVKKLERTVKQLRTARLTGDAPAAEGDEDIQDDVDIDGLSRMAYAALGHDQPTVPAEDMEEREEEEVPLRHKRSPAVSDSAGPSIVADKGKAPMPELDIPAEFLAEDAQARKRLEEEQASERLVHRLWAENLVQEDLPTVSAACAKELDDLMMRMTEIDWLNLMMQVGSNPALARELLGADVTEENFVERMIAIKEKKKRALADLRYRALKAHNGTITITAVKAMTKQQLLEEYEYICKRLEKDRLLSAQYNLFRPKPAISEPPSKRQRVDRDTSQPSGVPATTIPPADDPDSAGGGSPPHAGSADSAAPLSGSAAPTTAGGVIGVPDSTVTTSAAMDSADTCRHIRVSPFVDSAAGGINEFFLDSDEDERIGMSRVAADPDSDDEVLAEIIFQGKSISGHGVVLVDKLPDDEILDPRVKVETISESASSPPRTRRKHFGVRSEQCLWDKPVEDFFSSESESDDDMENYIPPLPYGEFKDWEMVSCPPGNSYIHVYHQQNRRRKYFTYLKQLLPHVYREDILLLRRQMNRYFRLNPDVNIGLDLWRDVNMLCQSLHSDDVVEFWRTQDEWVFYPIRAPLLERMLRHRLTVPPSYCRDVVVAGSVIQTIQDGLRESYECLASAPIVDMVINPPWNLPFLGAKGLTSPEQTATGKGISNPLMAVMVCPKPYGIQLTNVSIWKLLLRDVAVSFDSAVHRDHAGSFDAVVPSLVSAACCTAAGYFVVHK